MDVIGSTREQATKNMAGTLGIDGESITGKTLGESIAESGAKLGRVYETTGTRGEVAVTFVKPDGTEVDLNGSPALIAGFLGGFLGWKRKMVDE